LITIPFARRSFFAFVTRFAGRFRLRGQDRFPEWQMHGEGAVFNGNLMKKVLQ